MSEALLPPNASVLDRAIASAVQLPAELTGDIGVVGRVADCPEGLLPWQAWAMSVDNWDPEWPVQVKRASIAASVGVHRSKGTVAAIRRALVAAGFGRSVLVEGQSTIIRNGSAQRDGTHLHGTPTQWAEYQVYLERPLTIEQGEQLKSVLADVAPARCKLTALYFIQVAHTHNGAILRDGTQSRGVI